MKYQSQAITIRENEILFRVWSIADSAGALVGVACLIGFLAFVGAVAALTLCELLQAPGVWTILRCAVGWTLASVIGVVAVRAGFENPGGLLNLLLLGRAPCALQRMEVPEGPILRVERRLPFGKVWVVDSIPFPQSGPILAARTQLHWGEFPGLDVDVGNRGQHTFSVDNADATALARTLREWLGESAASATLCSAQSFSPEGLTRASSAIAFSPAATTVACAGWDGRLRLWDLASESLRATFEMGAEHALALEFSADGNLLACANWFDQLLVWELPGGKLLAKLDGISAHNVVHGLKALAFAPDGKSLALAGLDRKEARLWELPSGKFLGWLKEKKRGVWAAAFSPDGKLLASGNRVWGVATREPRITLAGQGWVGCLAFAPDGSLLASGWSDGKARLWRIPEGDLVATLDYDWVRYSSGSLAFSPDGKRLATAGGREGTVQLWEVPSGKPVASFGRHGSHVLALAFAPDGKTLRSASQDSVVITWIVPAES
ncbi:MAG: WD40 repeat domain-containing protein [Planctomycetes bacterium]|nr:WD40 repeat domain-containing protein [Planctomycetota bacterium]